MNLYVAIRAASSQDLLCRTRLTRDAAGAIESARVVALGMALLAEKWLLHLQHSRDYRAVRVMADRTILSGRLMLNQERSAFLSMTLIAGLDDGMLDQLRGSGRSVRVVTI